MLAPRARQESTSEIFFCGTVGLVRRSDNCASYVYLKARNFNSIVARLPLISRITACYYLFQSPK